MKVLFIAYYFPPCAGPGVRRSVRFVKGLGAHGIEPIVLTIDAKTFGNPDEYGVDPAALAELPAGLRVERTDGTTLWRLRRFLMRAKLMRLAQMILYPLFWERQAPWATRAIRRGLALIREVRPDVIYTSTGPFCTNRVGRALRRRTRVPWVTDYRDLWTGSWLKWWPTRLHFAWERRLERRCLAEADAVVANTPAAKERLAADFPGVDRAKIAVVTNGWDDPGPLEPTPPLEEKIVLLHTGSFDDRAVPEARGWVRRFLQDVVEHRRAEYDLSTHGPRHLFGALARLERDDPATAARVVLRLVGGGVHDSWRAEAERLGIAHRVELTGPVPFREARRMQRTADLLVLTTVSRHDGGPVPRVNAKIYEYMRAGRPILAMTDPGDVADFARGSGLGVVVPPRDEAAIATAIRDAVARRDGAKPPLRPDEAFIARFSNDALTAGLARVLASVAR